MLAACDEMPQRRHLGAERQTHSERHPTEQDETSRPKAVDHHADPRRHRAEQSARGEPVTLIPLPHHRGTEIRACIRRRWAP